MEVRDRELLELAAKAAEKQIVDWVFDSNSVPVAALDDGSRWQPLLENQLTDCMGDALRLAVKLSLRIDPDTEDRILVMFGLHTLGPVGEIREPQPSDPYAATRRAIVRAAAAIAQSFPATSSASSS